MKPTRLEDRGTLPDAARPMFDLMVKHYREAENGWAGPRGRHDHTKAGIDRRIFAGNAIATALRDSFGGTTESWSSAGLRAAHSQQS